MEDKKQRVASYGQEIPSVKRKTNKEDPITIMIMRSVGKVRSFKITPFFLYLGAVFILLNIAATIYFGNRFFDLRHINAIQSEKVIQLENEASKNLKTILRNKRYLAILEEYVPNVEAPKERKAGANQNIILQERSDVRDTGPVTKSSSPEDPSKQVVDIKDMAIKKIGSELTVNFRVVNLREFDNPIGGYIHLIAVGKDGYSPSAWTFPNEELRDGVPVDFRRGQLFLIQRFKPVEGNFYFPASADTPPSAVKVLVYNQTGTLLLEKEFEVGDGS